MPNDEITHDKATEAKSRLWFQAVLDNTVKTVNPWINSSGLRFNYSRHRSLSLNMELRLGEAFLLNTCLERYDRETIKSVSGYFSDSSLAMISMSGIESVNALEEIDLPPSIEASLRLSRCLTRRRSSRTYTGEAIEMGALATIVRAAAGITGYNKARLQDPYLGSVEISLRSTPSAGALYGVDLYLAVQRIRNLEQGLYLYAPRRDKLLLLQRQNDTKILDKIRTSCFYPDRIITHSRASFIGILVGRPWKVMRKYGDRGIRYMFIEAGEMTQNIHLTATALGYGSVESASFYDSEVNESLGLDGGTATVLHTIYVGVPSDLK